MDPYTRNKLNESIEELEDNQVKFSKKQTDIIKSLPEEDRIEIFESMYNEKKATSPYQMWLSLNRGWRIIVKVILLTTLIFCVVAYGTENGWKSFKELLQSLGQLVY